MKYMIFPFHLIEKNSKVILYGAGKVAQNYCKQNRILEHCNILFAVDKKADKESVLSGIKVKSTESLLMLDAEQYDYIVIAVMNEDSRREICKWLENNGIYSNKIINPQGCVLEWDKEYESIEEELKNSEKNKNYLQYIKANKLFDSKRLDIAVRYLIYRDWFVGIDKSENESLYRRFMLTRSSETKENLNHWEVGTINNSISKEKEMCKRIWLEGFVREEFIVTDNDLRIEEGQNKIAAAIVGGEDVCVHRVEGKKLADDVIDLGWFKRNGFREEDCIKLLRSYTDLYHGKVGMFVLFGTCKDYWNFIEKNIEKNMHIVGDVELDFTHNYPAFENLIFEMYSDYKHLGEVLGRKAQMLMHSPLKIKLVLVSDEDYTGNGFYEDMKILKLKIRESLGDIIDERCFITMHSSDSKDEFEHMKKLLLSVNGIRQLQNRMGKQHSLEFFEKLDCLKKWCEENQIKTDDVCVTGSAVMEAMGVRKCGDIDFTLCSNHRKRFMEGNYKLTDDRLDIIRQDTFFDQYKQKIDDDTIIENDNYHFYFYGLKFINLKYEYEKKKALGREKDKIDCRLIEIYNDYIGNFDNKEILRKQIGEELKKRGYDC